MRLDPDPIKLPGYAYVQILAMINKLYTFWFRNMFLIYFVLTYLEKIFSKKFYAKTTSSSGGSRSYKGGNGSDSQTRASTSLLASLRSRFLSLISFVFINTNNNGFSKRFRTDSGNQTIHEIDHSHFNKVNKVSSLFFSNTYRSTWRYTCNTIKL